MASQALLVVLAPTIVAVAADLDATVAVIGQARSITAAVAMAASVLLVARVGAIGISRLITAGGLLAAVACLGVAVAPTVAVYLAAHVVLGVAFAALLTGGFSGVAAFGSDRRVWAVGYVAGANGLAWIVVNPAVGAITDWMSWRLAQAVPAVIALIAAGLAGRAAPVPAGGSRLRFRDLLAERPARGWLLAELLAYSAWAALLTYIGAFFVESLGVRTALVGWILAAGAAAYFFTATRSSTLAGVASARPLVAAAAVVMGALAVVQLNVTGSVLLSVVVFSAIGVAAGVRTPASGALALGLMPKNPGAIMAVRTAATQLGYLVGAVTGGAVIGALGYGELGLVLAGGMAVSAVLVLRVAEPREER